MRISIVFQLALRLSRIFLQNSDFLSSNPSSRLAASPSEWGQQRPRFAVCLAAYNGLSTIVQQIESILAQENVDLQIFVSVDQSSDGTEKLISEWALTEVRLTLLPCGQCFGGAGRNFFRLLQDVDLDGYDYLSFADQDDIWFHDKLWRAHCLLTLQAGDGYSSNVTAFWEDGREVLVNKSQEQRRWDFLFEAAGPGCTYVLSVGVAERLRSFLIANRTEIHEVGLHDWYIYAFTRANGYKWIIDPRTSMAYRQHAENLVGVNVGWRALQKRIETVVCGWGITQARMIARLSGLENESFFIPWRRPGRLGMLWLALNAYRCRRKILDRFVFAGACLVLAIVGDHSRAPR